MPETYQGGSGLAPHPPIPLHILGHKGCSGFLEWVSLNCTMPENIMWVLGWRPNHPYHCTPWARKGVFGSLEWVPLVCTMPETYQVGSGVAPQPPIPLHTMGQKRCFWIPGVGVFAIHNARNTVGILGWRTNHPYHCTPWAAKVFLDP